MVNPNENNPNPVGPGILRDRLNGRSQAQIGMAEGGYGGQPVSSHATDSVAGGKHE